MLEWLLNHHRDRRLRALVLGIDDSWCRVDSKLTPHYAFPFWLYSSDPIVYAANMIRLKSFEAAERKIKLMLQLAPPARSDGYDDYDAGRVWDPAGAMEGLKEDVETEPAAAVAELQKIPGVAYVEPDLGFTAYVRCNGRVAPQSVAGASVPNASAKFKIFDAGQMISRSDADEAVISDVLSETCGYAKTSDAVGQTIEFLTTRNEIEGDGSASTNQNKTRKAEPSEEDGSIGFFGLPLGEDTQAAPDNTVTARTFRIAGVLGQEKREGAAQGGPIGLMFNASIYIPLPAAHDWVSKH